MDGEEKFPRVLPPVLDNPLHIDHVQVSGEDHRLLGRFRVLLELRSDTGGRASEAECLGLHLFGVHIDDPVHPERDLEMQPRRNHAGELPEPQDDAPVPRLDGIGRSQRPDACDDENDHQSPEALSFVLEGFELGFRLPDDLFDVLLAPLIASLVTRVPRHKTLLSQLMSAFILPDRYLPSNRCVNKNRFLLLS